jgi:hypothetical protein
VVVELYEEKVYGEEFVDGGYSNARDVARMAGERGREGRARIQAGC